MSLVEQLRVEISLSINTLRRRYANTTDAAEKKVIVKLIESLNGKLSRLNQAALLNAAEILGAATDELEKAVAAAQTGPFDGYLSALERHLDNLNMLLGAMHSAEDLAPAPEDGGDLAPAPRARRAPRRGRRGLRALDLPIPSKNFADLKDEYQSYYDSCQVRPEYKGNVAFYTKRLDKGRPSYEEVGRDLRIPWQFIGVIHGMECGFNFAAHLHNGDPLTNRTVHVPSGRPVAGTPPFTWRQSATDALMMKGFHEITDWSIPRMLYLLERYNGFGYRMRRLVSPYLWSFSNHYVKGKFVKDGVYDPNAVSKQCGAALVLKAVSV